MRFLQRIANTSMPRGKHSLPLPRHTRGIKLHLHQLIHILQHQHIAIELHDAIIFDQTERRQFRPAVVESRIVGIVDINFW
jgi:hypothetical protein